MCRYLFKGLETDKLNVVQTNLLKIKKTEPLVVSECTANCLLNRRHSRGVVGV